MNKFVWLTLNNISECKKIEGLADRRDQKAVKKQIEYLDGS